MEEKNRQLIDIIEKTKVDPSFCYNPEGLLDIKIGDIKKNARCVLDFGQSSRNRYAWFDKGQIETGDINDFGEYPDHILDICDATTFPAKTYDGIICNAVIEHVYDPAQAVKNMYNALEKGGRCLCYAPFIYRYHGHEKLKYQDYFRYTRDGLAYLFRDFSDVTLYPMRGKTSSALAFLMPYWKKKVEDRFPQANKYIDRIIGGAFDPLQTSGYVIWAIK